MNKRIRNTILLSGAAAVFTVGKAVSDFISYKKMKNKDLYINADMPDINELRPVIRKSICTGEKEAGFKDKSGNFTSYMLIKDNKDLDEFKKKYNLDGEIPVEY